MPKRSVLLFGDYTVNEICFKDFPNDNEGKEFNLHPQFERKLENLGNNRYDYTISVDINPTDNDPAPFKLYVSITGHFLLEESTDTKLEANVKDTILKNNTAAILFPYLRAIVSMITINANISALLLPIMNFSEDESNEDK